jgi:hypothetical protein
MTTRLVSTGLAAPRAPRQAGRPGRHEGDPAADGLLKDRSRSAAGELGQVLRADNLGAVRGVPELFEADVAQADTGDETLVARPDHGAQLLIEAGVGAAGAGQTAVDHHLNPGPAAGRPEFAVAVGLRHGGGRVRFGGRVGDAAGCAGLGEAVLVGRAGEQAAVTAAGGVGVSVPAISPK